METTFVLFIEVFSLEKSFYFFRSTFRMLMKVKPFLEGRDSVVISSILNVSFIRKQSFQFHLKHPKHALSSRQIVGKTAKTYLNQTTVTFDIWKTKTDLHRENANENPNDF